jgi:Mrp family chromosome partitioning ATPase
MLKERYEVIIVDSSPIGIVSDSFHIAAQADACLLVVRPGVTLRDLLRTTLKEIQLNGIKGLSLVINDIHSGAGHYRYGHKYGYTNDDKLVKRSLFDKIFKR